MERVLQFVADYRWWISGLLGLLMLFYLWRAFSARREAARAMFKLEREQAQAKYGRNVIVLVILLAILASVFGATTYLLPSLDRTPEPTITATPGLLPAPTLTHTPPPPTATPTATATQVRPTRPVRPTDTPEVVVTETPVSRPPSCPDPNVRIVSPGVNQVLSGHFQVRGTANIPDFDYYKVEVGLGSSPRDDAWTVVGALHDSPVVNGILETLNAGDYTPGTYTLRLVVVNMTGNFPEPCRVTVTVQR
jgi:hypothetical protein